MKIRVKNFSLRQIICCITGVVSFLIFVGLTVFTNVKADGILEQQMAKRWSNVGESAQISCFFAQGTEVTKDTIRGFEAGLESSLKEEAIESASTNPNARMWIDAYSATGKVTLQNGKKTLADAKAIGVGGEFFQFHPLKLLYGNFFSASDVMEDYVILDEDAAWQLFGSNNVAGMQVTIAGVPHIVAGVIERADGRLNDAAGNQTTTVYLSNHSLETYGISYGINCYEVVMPNPVEGYALKTVKENMKMEDGIEYIENTTRYSLLNLGKVFLEFGSRSMNSQAIIYPYWENVARGWEDIFAMILLFRVLFLLFPIVLLVILVIKLWKGKTWTWKDIPELLKRCGSFLLKGIKGIGRKLKHYKKKTEKEADLEEEGTERKTGQWKKWRERR